MDDIDNCSHTYIYTPLRMRPEAMDMGSVNSLHDLHDTPLPTPPAEKREVTIKRLSYVLGFLYAIFLVLLGTLLHVKTAYIEDPWTPILTIYITVSGLVILCIFIVDIKLFTRRIRKQVEVLRSKAEEQEAEYLRQLDEHIESNNRKFNEDCDQTTRTSFIIPEQVELEKIEHSYCFAQGRHAGSVYLKFGAAAFALGLFVHSILLVVTVHYSISINNGECIHVKEYISGLLQCVYSLVQLVFVFNYSNLVILKNKTIARMAFLHIMAGNICLWVSAVTYETKIAYKAYEWIQKQKNSTNATTLENSQDNCSPTEVALRIFDNYSAYLFPFTVEFNILVVGIFYVIWANIGKCHHSAEDVQDFHHSLYAPNNISGDVNSPHPLDIHISCRNAMCGLFSSLFVIVVFIVVVILGFVFGSIPDDELQFIGIIFADSMNLLFHTTMLIITAVAFYKTQALDINKHPVPKLDDVLLYICVPAFFLESMLTVIPTFTALHLVKFLDTIIMSLQMILQVAFIIDGLRRCSNSRKLRRTRPGRELVLLLLVTNVAMWCLYTFSYQSPESKDIRYVYYGKELWLAIGHICKPIIMFFMFHSSVCIADIWSHAYNPGVGH